jgi:enoyl-CoA hydratase/carnithine racemase
MLYTGGTLRGVDAQAAGLLDRLVDEDELVPAAVAFANEIAASGPLAVAEIRRTMRGAMAEQVEAAMARETEAQLALAPSEDFAEGVRAMGERRPPNFTGR